MSLGDVIARLAVNLTLDTGEFLAGSTKAQGALGKLQDQMKSLGDRWTQTGKTLSTRISLPIAGLGAGIIKVAADFESGMNRVAISTKAPAAEMEGMRKLALRIGKDTTFGATEASDAMDMLAKNGLSAKQILDGAATAAVNLASAAGSDLSPAANAITDVMQQFKLTAGELPGVVNQITGAVNESKLDFVDFAGAISQAGGVAASSGVSFKDFNAVIAGTSSLFGSGSDAGTSFKTFITSLSGNSEAASKKIAAMGLRFYDAQGNLRSMGEVADELRTKLGGLSEEARTSELKGIFGVDAMRTAIGLMDLGSAGLDKIAGKIATTDAAAQSAQRLRGFSGQLEELKGAVETLAIAIADTGLLKAVTRIVSGLANLISRLSETNPFLIKLAVGVVALTAAMGPLMLIMGTLGATLLPLFLSRLSPIGLAISAFINPVGTLVAVLGRLALSLGGMTILQTLAPMLLRFLGPIGLLITAGTLIYQNWDKIAPVLTNFKSKAEAAFSAFSAEANKALGPEMTKLVKEAGDAFSELWKGPLGAELEGASSRLSKVTGEFQTIVTKDLGELGGRFEEVFSKFTKIAGTDLIALASNGIKTLTDFFGQIKQGIKEFNSAFETAKAAIDAYQNAIAGFENAVKGILSRMVNSIQTWITDKLGGIWTRAIAKIETVRKAFFSLYDAVVGHSYVPDMVDGIAGQMKRLDTVMVDKAKSATTKTAQHFKKLGEDLKGLTARLFPEIAARDAVRKDEGTIAAGVAAGSLTAEEGVEYRRRLGVASGAGDAVQSVGSAASGGLAAVGEGLGDFVTNVSDAARKVVEKNASVAASFQDMADRTLSSLQNLSSAIRGGGFLDVLGGLLDLGLQLGSLGAFGSKISARINATPKYANGTNYAAGGLSLVGERGPELVNLPRGSQVIPNHRLSGGRGVVNNYYGPGADEFWGRVDGRAANVAAPMSAQAAGLGSTGAQVAAARQRSRSLA